MKLKIKHTKKNLILIKIIFYNKVKEKVKFYFNNNKIDHHANKFWVIKVSLQIFLYFCLLYYVFMLN